jgi:predicted O-methyltransferase YrrM
MSFSHTLQSHFDHIGSIICQIGEQLEGNLICDIHPSNIIVDRNRAKISNLQHLATNKQYICEIGVNAGHSLLLMLDTNPTAKYLLFDLGLHKYTKPCIDYIRSIYPNTEITIEYGDSMQTINNYMESQHKKHFIDLCHIDGGHTAEVLTSDLNNSIKLCQKNGIIVVDDTDYGVILQVVNEKLKQREIVLYDDENLKATNLHAICQKNTHHDPLDYIDKIIYINLDKRADRKMQICQEFKKMGIPSSKFERYPAQLTNPGTYGCGFSHIQVLKTALERGYQNICVMEDDFLFDVDRATLDYYFEYFFTEFKQSWDVIMITYALDDQEECDDPIVGRVRMSHNAAGYIVNQHYIQTLIDTLEEGHRNLMMTDVHWLYANDAYWINLQQKDRWFYFKQKLGHQSTTVGDTGFWS